MAVFQSQYSVAKQLVDQPTPGVTDRSRLCAFQNRDISIVNTERKLMLRSFDQETREYSVAYAYKRACAGLLRHEASQLHHPLFWL